MSSAESNKRIARNSIYMSIRMTVVLLVTLYTTRVVLSVLGVTDFGVYNVVCGFVSMFVFLNTSMSTSVNPSPPPLVCTSSYPSFSAARISLYWFTALSALCSASNP